MTDPISVASFALSIIKTAGEQLNKLRERAQATKDLEIKEHVGNLYDTMNAIKEAFSRLADENKELKRQLDGQTHQPEKPEIMQVGDTNYYYLKGGTDGPYCQPCYATKDNLIKLLPSEPWSGGIRRECPVCHEYFYEKRMDRSPIRLGGRRGGGGPNSWME